MASLKQSAKTVVETTVEIAPELREALDIELATYTRLSEEIAALEIQKKAANANVEAIREDIGAEKLDLDNGYKVTRVQGVTSTLDVKLLLAARVPLATIEKCTVTTPKAPYTLITPPSKKGKK